MQKRYEKANEKMQKRHETFCVHIVLSIFPRIVASIILIIDLSIVPNIK